VDLEKELGDSYLPNIMRVRVNADKGALAVLSDIHEGLNNREYLQDTVKFLVSLGDRCKVVIGGDSTNTVTRNSKGTTIDEWASGSDQIFALADDIAPLYESGQLIGITTGNHTQRVFNDAYITLEAMLASILGDRNLYKGSMGIIYFNVNKNLYVHHILHKHKTTLGAYDFFNADVNWFEHKHKPLIRPKVIIEHNKYAKIPVVKTCYDLFQSSFQMYPDYAKNAGYRPSVPGYFICEMSGDVHNHKVVPYQDSVYRDLLENGYKF
jgi:hypothetical protein